MTIGQNEQQSSAISDCRLLFRSRRRRVRPRGTFDKDHTAYRVVASVDTNVSFFIPSRLLVGLGSAFNVAIFLLLVQCTCSDVFDVQVVPVNDTLSKQLASTPPPPPPQQDQFVSVLHPSPLPRSKQICLAIVCSIFVRLQSSGYPTHIPEKRCSKAGSAVDV